MIRHTGGLAVPLSARIESLPLTEKRLIGPGTIAVARFRMISDSGDVTLNTIGLVGGRKDRRLALEEVRLVTVLLVTDVNDDGRLTTTDEVLAEGVLRFDGERLTLVLDEPFEIPAGETDMIVLIQVSDEE